MRYPSPSPREIGHRTGIKENVCSAWKQVAEHVFERKKKNARIFILLLFPIFVFYFFFPLRLSSILFWQNCAGLFLTTYEKPERN